MFIKLRQKFFNILKRSERYTHTDMAYLAKGGFWLTVGEVASTVLSLALAVAFANLVPKETYGTYRFVLSMSGILAIASLQGMSTAVVQATAKGFEASIFSALKTKLRWSIAGSLGALALGGYYLIGGNNALAAAFLIVSIFLPAAYSFGIYSSFLTGKKLFRYVSQFRVASQLAVSTALIGVLWFSENLYLLLFAYFALTALAHIFFFRMAVKKFPPQGQDDPGVRSYGKHLSFVSIVGAVATHIDSVLLFYYLGPAPVAVYNLAIAPVERLRSIFANIRLLVLPKFSAHDKDATQRTLFKKIGLLMLLLAAVIGMYYLAAPFLFEIFFPKYLEAVSFSRFYAISLIVAGSLPGTFLASQKAIKEQYVASIVPGVAKIALMILLVIPYGIWGVVVANVLARILAFGLAAFFARRI